MLSAHCIFKFPNFHKNRPRVELFTIYNSQVGLNPGTREGFFIDKKSSKLHHLLIFFSTKTSDVFPVKVTPAQVIILAGFCVLKVLYQFGHYGFARH